MPEERPRRNLRGNEQKKNKSSGWQLIAVQSISCVVLILIALVFRMIGGSAFSQLRESFNHSIMSNSILATLAALIESPKDDSSKKEESSESGDTSGSEASSSEEEPSGDETEDTSENGGTTNTGGSTAPTGSAANKTTTEASKSAATSTTASMVAAVGGKDISVSNRIYYAPNGATFAPLRVNRLANKPLESGKVTSRFGYRVNPNSREESFHQGLDIADELDTPIAAMYFGVVSEVGQSSSYGNYVRIFHGNGLEVLYAHCSQILADKDAVIRAGEIVARVGSTGDSTGPHLHIEVTLHGVAYDPAGIVPLTNYA